MASSGPTSFFCGNCGDEYPAPHLGTCQNCDAPGFLCEGCLKKHTRTPRLPKFLEHVFIKSDLVQDYNAILGAFDLGASPVECEVHRKPLFLSCASHGNTALLCVECVGAHTGHCQLTGLSEEATAARAALRDAGCPCLSAAHDDAVKLAAQAATDLDAMDSQFDAAREQLASAREAIISDVVARFTRLHEELESMREIKVAAFNERMREADTLRDRVEVTRQSLDSAAVVFSDADIVMHQRSMSSKAQGLQKAVADLAGSPLPPAFLSVAFGTSLDEVRTALQCLGIVVGTATEADNPPPSAHASVIAELARAEVKIAELSASVSLGEDKLQSKEAAYAQLRTDHERQADELIVLAKHLTDAQDSLLARKEAQVMDADVKTALAQRLDIATLERAEALKEVHAITQRCMELEHSNRALADKLQQLSAALQAQIAKGAGGGGGPQAPAPNLSPPVAGGAPAPPAAGSSSAASGGAASYASNASAALSRGAQGLVDVLTSPPLGAGSAPGVAASGTGAGRLSGSPIVMRPGGGGTQAMAAAPTGDNGMVGAPRAGVASVVSGASVPRRPPGQQEGAAAAGRPGFRFW